MPKPFKFRYVNEIAGGFVLLVIVLLVVGIVVAGHAQRWFEPVHTLKIGFPPEGSLDLQKGAEVHILGTQVGTVDRITVAADGGISGRISIRGKFIRFVGADSKAIVKKKFGLAGDAYLEITKGSGPELPDDSVLMCTKDTEIMETINDVVRQVREVTLPAIEQAQKAVLEYTKLAEQLNLIVAGLEKGEGAAGEFLKNPKLAEQLREIIANSNMALKDTRKTMELISGEVEDLPGTMIQARKTLEETEKLLEALQKHWLLRKYVQQEVEPSTMIPPADVGGKP